MPPIRSFFMDPKYIILRIIYNLVKEDSDPTTFPCTYRDIILKRSFDIMALQEQLDQLAIEDLVKVKKLDRPVICITKKGFEQINTLEVTQQEYDQNSL